MKLCSYCRRAIGAVSGAIGMKRCTNSYCIRTVWVRDINPSINILNLFQLTWMSTDGEYKLEEFARRGATNYRHDGS